MKLNYEIYGCTLKLEFQNDLLLLEHLKNHVGKIIEDDDTVNADASIVFKKTSAFELEEMYEHFVFDEKRNVFVEPTRKQAIVGYLNNDDTIVHFYDGYYLIVFSYSEKEVHFNYCDSFLKIDFLLMEFFKYCIFPIKMSDGWLPLHSSCIISPKSNNAILFVGDSGCGKSSNALLMALNSNYWFCNDEVTYLSYNADGFRVNPTTDKVKVCSKMHDLLLKSPINFETAKIEDEFICDVSNMRIKNKCLPKDVSIQLDMVFLLKRDDSENSVRIYEANIIEKYRCLIENSNISVWTSRDNKRVIMDVVEHMTKEVKILSLVYPTKEINNISTLIEEKYYEYKN